MELHLWGIHGNSRVSGDLNWNFSNKNGNANAMPWENVGSKWNFIAGKIIELNCGCSSHVWWPHDRFVQSGNHPIAMVMRKITPLGSVLEAGPYKCTPRPLQAPRERMAEIYCVNWQRHKCKCLTNYRYSFAVSIVDSIHINIIYIYIYYKLKNKCIYIYIIIYHKHITSVTCFTGHVSRHGLPWRWLRFPAQEMDNQLRKPPVELRVPHVAWGIGATKWKCHVLPSGKLT